MSECIGDGGTCGLGGYCKECPHVKDQELVEKIIDNHSFKLWHGDKENNVILVSDLPKVIPLCRQHFRTATLDEVKELAEHEKVGANKDDGEGDICYDMALTDLVNAIDNMRGNDATNND